MDWVQLFPDSNIKKGNKGAIIISRFLLSIHAKIQQTKIDGTKI